MLSSVVGPEGSTTPRNGAGEYLSRNPADLGDVVARVELGSPETLRSAAAEARRAQREWAQVQEITDTCDFLLGEGGRLYGQTVPSEIPDKQLLTFRVPVGVATVITAGNFPVAVRSWYLVPALLCGNAVVWKPAEYAAAAARAVAALADGLVDKVGFTGSSAVGSRVGELCGRYLQSPCLELGGKSPMGYRLPPELGGDA